MASWNHTWGCIDRYAIVLIENEGQGKGEMVFENVPTIYNPIEIDQLGLAHNIDQHPRTVHAGQLEQLVSRNGR